MSDLPELAGVRHEFVDAGGLRTHVALAGPEDAPPLVLVHGWPQHWWTWRGVIPTLAESHRVIVPDLRGHGWTEAPRSGYAKEQLATDLLALFDTLGVERVSWVGHDWGGWIGMLAALRAPERFERMLTLAIAHLWTAPHPRQLALLGYQGPLSTPLLGPRIAGPMIRSILQSGRGDEPLGAADMALFAEHTSAEVTVAMYRTFLTREVLPIVRGRYARTVLKIPTLALVGERDVVTRGMSDGLVKNQPQLRVRVLGGVGHWLPEQRPQSILDWVRGP